jgi:hypothetical protein
MSTAWQAILLEPSPTRAPAAFDDKNWIFELKHDGFRARAYIGWKKPSFDKRSLQVHNPCLLRQDTRGRT